MQKFLEKMKKIKKKIMENKKNEKKNDCIQWKLSH